MTSRTSPLAIAAASAALLLGGVLHASPAHADSGSLTLPAELVLYGTCVDYPLGYSASVPADDHWQIVVHTVDARGDDLGGVVLHGTGPAQGTAVLDVCNFDHEEGPVTVLAELRNHGTIPYTTTQLPSQTVLMRRARTTTTAKTRDAKVRHGRHVRIRTAALVEEPGGMLPLQYGEVYVERRTRAGWRRVAHAVTSLNDRGRATVRLRIRKRGRHALRVVTRSEEHWSGSRSGHVRVRVR